MGPNLLYILFLYRHAWMVSGFENQPIMLKSCFVNQALAERLCIGQELSDQHPSSQVYISAPTGAALGLLTARTPKPTISVLHCWHFPPLQLLHSFSDMELLRVCTQTREKLIEKFVQLPLAGSNWFDLSHKSPSLLVSLPHISNPQSLPSQNQFSHGL